VEGIGLVKEGKLQSEAWATPVRGRELGNQKDISRIILCSSMESKGKRGSRKGGGAGTRGRLIRGGRMHNKNAKNEEDLRIGQQNKTKERRLQAGGSGKRGEGKGWRPSEELRVVKKT